MSFITYSRRMQRNKLSSSKTSSRCLAMITWRRLGRRKKVTLTKKSYTEDEFKTSSRYLQYVFTMTKVCWEIIQKKGKKCNNQKIWKTAWVGIELLISKAFTDSNISHNEFVSVNNMLKKYCNLKQEVKNLKTLLIH